MGLCEGAAECQRSLRSQVPGWVRPEPLLQGRVWTGVLSLTASQEGGGLAEGRLQRCGIDCHGLSDQGLAQGNCGRQPVASRALVLACSLLLDWVPASMPLWTPGSPHAHSGARPS